MWYCIKLVKTLVLGNIAAMLKEVNLSICDIGCLSSQTPVKHNRLLTEEKTS